MKRIVVIMLLVSAVADARRVVHIATLHDLCPGGTSWEATNACLQRQGKPTLLRDLPDVKLVRFPQDHRFRGVYLYARDNFAWHIAGSVARSDVELISFEPIHKPDGYRFDLGMADASMLSLDQETAQPCVMRYHVAMLCTGKPLACRELITACDAYVQGKARFWYRGTIRFDGEVPRLVGDRTNAGDVCAAGQ